VLPASSQRVASTSNTRRVTRPSGARPADGRVTPVVDRAPLTMCGRGAHPGADPEPRRASAIARNVQHPHVQCTHGREGRLCFHSLAGMTLPKVRLGSSVGHRVVARVVASALGTAVVRNIGSRIDPALMRLTGGRFSSVATVPALLLTHTGAKSGRTRTTTLVYFTDADRVIVIASNFGAPHRPAWYHNVKANPEVTLSGRGFSGRFVAEEMIGQERNRLFALATRDSSPYDRYQRRAGKPIPVIAFHPIR
jgi:deazaflavin-dependent oxidoreductase (nitroreductase family)